MNYRARKPGLPIKFLVLLTCVGPLTGSSLAIGLGAARVSSILSQPLSVSVPISIDPGEGIATDTIRARLANPQQHNAAGVPLPASLRNASIAMVNTANGASVLITTPQPINEPLLNFLIELDWGSGRMLREISVFLDPPGYQTLPQVKATSSPQTRTPQPTPKPVTVAQTTPARALQPVMIDTPIFVDPPAARTVERSKPAVSVQQPSNPQPPRRKIVITDNQYGPVSSGDTLTEIALAAKKGTKASLQDIMRAIYAANPNAFSGSMDALKRGAKLTIPDLTAKQAQVMEKLAEKMPPQQEPPQQETTAKTDPNEQQAPAKPTAEAPAKEAPPAEEITKEEIAPEEAADEKTVAVAEAEKEATKTPENTEQQQAVLKILPQDNDAAQIAQGLSQQYEEQNKAALADDESATTPKDEKTADQKKDSPAPAQDNTSADNNAQNGSSAQTDADAGAENTALLQQVQSLESERDSLQAKLEETNTNLAETREALNRANDEISNLKLKIESATATQVAANPAATQEPGKPGHLIDKILSWLPWLGAILLLPLLLYYFFKRRNNEDNDERTPLYAAHRDSQIAPTPVSRSNQFGGESQDDPAEEPHSFSASTASAYSAAGMSALHSADEDINPPDDIFPTSPETAEIVRPNLADQEPSALSGDQRINDPDPDTASLDAAQEAEIYLAYGQHSLAEKVITHLLDHDPDNDRFKLLQLRLFAETMKLDEMQHLSVDILERYPDSHSGMHQQVQKICEQAFSHQANMLDSEKDGQKSDEHLEATFATGSEHTVYEEDPTSNDLTAETLYTDDIQDYLSETLSELDGFNTSSFDVPTDEVDIRPETTGGSSSVDVDTDISELDESGEGSLLDETVTMDKTFHGLTDDELESMAEFLPEEEEEIFGEDEEGTILAEDDEGILLADNEDGTILAEDDDFLVDDDRTLLSEEDDFLADDDGTLFAEDDSFSPENRDYEKDQALDKTTHESFDKTMLESFSDDDLTEFDNSRTEHILTDDDISEGIDLPFDLEEEITKYNESGESDKY